jgi:hypothetical protein
VAGPGGASYCDPIDLEGYAPPRTLAQVTNDVLLKACAEATERADAAGLRARYTLGLISWGDDVRGYTAQVAVYLVLQRIGWQPRAGADNQFEKNYFEALGYPDHPGSGWFPGIGRKAINPNVEPAIAPQQDAVHKLPQVYSDPPRGWQQYNSRGRPVIG